MTKREILNVKENLKKKRKQAGHVMHTCNHSTQEAEAGGSPV
jgi:hypothetical protein